MRVRNRFVCLSLILACALPSFAKIETNSAALKANLPDPTEKNIIQLTTDMLEHSHYEHHAFDQEMAGKAFERYLDVLDGLHLHFVQTDLDEFQAYRTNFVQLVKDGDATPCRKIFARFLERVEQRVNFSTNLVQTDKFDFTGHDRYTPDRHKLPYAKDLVEAKDIWRQNIRSEYLQEKLGAPDVKFTGPVNVDSKGNAEVQLKRDKKQPLSFEFLPLQFFDAAGKPLGSVKLDKTQSNAVVRIEKARSEKSKLFKKKFYSADGKELGTVSIRRGTDTNSLATTSDKPDHADAAPQLDLNASASGNKSKSSSANTNVFVATIQLNQKNLPEIVKTITNRYVHLLKTLKDLTPDDVFEFYVNSLARAYDPHTEYMGHSQFENFAIQMKLSLFGIGAKLQSDEGYCKIAELLPGPAERSKKVKAGDRIVAVAQGEKDAVECVGMPLNKVVEMIRGQKGTEVRLTIIPADSADSSVREVVSLVRDEIHLEDAEAKAKLFEVPGEKDKALRLGVIDLPSFYGDMEARKPGERKSTTVDVARLLRRLNKEKVDGVILDLRRNGGGFLEEAINLTGLFITKGPVVQTKNHEGEVVTDSDNDPRVLYDGPLIILTSRGSASASEILAGALQDYNRALIVGDHATFGKGTVQKMYQLSPILDQHQKQHAYDAGALKLTQMKFYRAAGSSTQLKGVISDIELPSINNHSEFGEASMDNAMPWDEVPSADPQNLNRVKPYLAELQKRSSLRVQKDKDFAYIREDIEQYKKIQADKSVSLNEAERLAEKKELEGKIDARKKERLARKKPNEKVYELTLKNFEDPQLHPPAAKTNDMASASIDILDDDPESLADAKVPEQDVRLEEAKRILVDYISLIGKSPSISKAH